MTIPGEAVLNFAEVITDFAIAPSTIVLDDGERLHTEAGVLRSLLHGAAGSSQYRDVDHGIRSTAADVFAAAVYGRRDLGQAVEYLISAEPQTPIHLIARLVDASEIVETMMLANPGVSVKVDELNGVITRME